MFGLEGGSCVSVSLWFVRSSLIAKVQNVIEIKLALNQGFTGSFLRL